MAGPGEKIGAQFGPVVCFRLYFTIRGPWRVTRVIAVISGLVSQRYI